MHVENICILCFINKGQVFKDTMLKMLLGVQSSWLSLQYIFSQFATSQTPNFQQNLTVSEEKFILWKQCICRECTFQSSCQVYKFRWASSKVVGIICPPPPGLQQGWLNSQMALMASLLLSKLCNHQMVQGGDLNTQLWLLQIG